MSLWFIVIAPTKSEIIWNKLQHEENQDLKWLLKIFVVKTVHTIVIIIPYPLKMIDLCVYSDLCFLYRTSVQSIYSWAEGFV